MAMPKVANAPSTPNPFSTRFVRPDQTAYRFAQGENLHSFTTRLLAQLSSRGTAAIIGPHGTGKSTLLHTLLPRLEQVFSAVHWIRLDSATDAVAELRQRQREFRSRDRQSAAASRCLVIDGFEQLPWVARQRLVYQTLRWRQAAFRNRHGQPPQGQPPQDCLLVTAHRPQLVVATLYRTNWDDTIVRSMTEEKLEGLPWRERVTMLRAAERHAVMINHSESLHRSVRDYWFALYDEYERLRSHPPFAAGIPRRNAQ